MGNHLITVQATAASDCYLPYKTHHVSTYITTNTRVETRTCLQHNISAFSSTTEVRGHPHDNEFIHLQCKPRHHQHLITQHIPSVQQQEMLEKLAALPPVPIKRITKELMGEVLQESLSNDNPFWLHPSFLMGCIRFVVSIMSTVACIMKKRVAAWKPPALIGFLSLCRKDKNNTKMDDKDMDGSIYQPSGIIPTVIRPQESHGLCVTPQPA